MTILKFLYKNVKIKRLLGKEIAEDCEAVIIKSLVCLPEIISGFLFRKLLLC